MKSLILKSGVLSLLFVLLPLSVNAAPDVGQAAPDFTLMSASGEKVSLKDYQGKTVVLEWTNHQCPFVVKHYGSGNMQALQKRWTDKGVVWLSILSSAEGKQGYLNGQEAMDLGKEQGVHRTHLLMDADGSVGKAYAAKTTPHMYVIDGNGVLQYMGAIDSDRSASPESIKTATNYIDEAVPAVMAGEAPKVAKTRPYGCSVKYK
ncbi:redoxin domain-containing protein [Porticoccaceae bacterium LTM1]|nr:redoxin domain-containing protein [Porticoccaceae bacterium LTM1]